MNHEETIIYPPRRHSADPRSHIASNTGGCQSTGGNILKVKMLVGWSRDVPGERWRSGAGWSRKASTGRDEAVCPTPGCPEGHSPGGDGWVQVCVTSSWGRKIGCSGPHPSHVFLSPLWTAHQTVYVVVRQAPQPLCRTKWELHQGHGHIPTTHTYTHTHTHKQSFVRWIQERLLLKVSPLPALHSSLYLLPSLFMYAQSSSSAFVRTRKTHSFTSTQVNHQVQ